jgi:hypothetical protein
VFFLNLKQSTTNNVKNLVNKSTGILAFQSTATNDFEKNSSTINNIFGQFVNNQQAKYWLNEQSTKKVCTPQGRTGIDQSGRTGF